MTRVLLLICCALLLPAMGRAGISVQTLSATEITATAATVRGQVSTFFADATVMVEFGTTPALGQQLAVGAVLAGSSDAIFAKRLTGLPSGQLIYYRFSALIGSVISAGSVLSFSTLTVPPPGPPSIGLSGPITVGGTFARIYARIDTSGGSTNAYATCQASGGPRIFAQLDGTIGNDGPSHVIFNFYGLSRQTAYSFEIVARNASGSTTIDGTFTTVVNAPPTAGDSVGFVVRGGTTVVSLPINDPDGDGLSFDLETLPAFGPITYLGERVAYTAGPGFRDEDTFSYVVRDSFGAEARGTVVLRNPFLENAGSYDAALVPAGAEKADGFVRLTVGRQGAFTGELWNDGVRYPLLGSFALGGRFDGRLSAEGHAVRVQLAINPMTRLLTGTVLDGSRTRQLQAGRRSAVEPAMQAGRYTAEFDAPNCPANPSGHGWTALKVSPGGMARFVVRLACGERVLASAPVREDGSVLLPIAPRTGFALLQIFFASAPEYDLVGAEFPFALPAEPAVSPRPPINGSLYFAPGITHSLLRFSRGDRAVIDLHFGKTPLLPGGADAEFAVQADGTFVLQLSVVPKVELSADLAAGVFRGSIPIPAFPELAVTFNGVFLQKRNIGSGLFYSRSNGALPHPGEVRLSPR